MAITGASLQPIYDRLNSIAKYHPVSAETFSDWSLEAGDIVTIAREETEYEGPVHSTRIVWRGSPQVTINSTGKQERDSIAKTSKRKYGRSGAGMYGNQALYHDMYSEDGKLHSELLHTESVLRVEFENEISSVWSEFEITASHLEAEFTDQVNSLRGEFEITASHLEAEFTDQVNSLRGEFEITASHLEAEFTDDINSLRGELEITASHLQTEFTDEVNSLRGELEITASHLQAEFTDDINSLRGELEITASHLQAEFTDDINSLRGELEITASHLQAEFTDDINSLRGEFEITASHLQAEFTDDINSLRGELEITASHLQTEFTDDINSLRGELEITASGLQTEFTNEIGSVRSEMVQTASSWEVRVSGVVDENGNVTAASIKTAINEDGSQIVISANQINLNGYVKATDITAEYINSKIADIPTVNAMAISASGNIVGHAIVYGKAFMVGEEAPYRNISDPMMDIQLLGPTNNVYTLQYKKSSDSSWQDVGTFSRATTLTGAWGSGADADKFIVEAQPQGDQYKYSPPLRLNGSTQYANFSAEITERTGSTVVAKKSVYGYLIAGGTGTGSYVRVNTANDGSGVNVAQLNIGSLLEDNVTFTTNGTKNPGPGYIGFGSVNVDVQSTPVTPSISYTWSNTGKLTVTTTPTPQDDLVRQLRQGTTSWSGTTATVQVLAEYGSQGQYTENTNFTATVDAGPLATNAGYVGRAAVGLTGPTWTTAPSASVTGNSNTATISTTGRTNASGTADNLDKTVPIYMTQGDWDTSTNKKYVYAHVTSSSDANRIARLEVNAGTIYSNGVTAGTAAGKNAVTINKGTWSGGQISFTKSEGTASTKSVQLTAAAASWNGNTASVAIWDGTAADAQHGVNTGYTVTVNAAGRYYAGSAGVTLLDPTWTTAPNANITVGNNTATVSTTGRVNTSGTAANLNKTIPIYMSQGDWDSSNKKYVYSHVTSTANANRIARIQVDAGTVYTAGETAGKNAVTITKGSWSSGQVQFTKSAGTASTKGVKVGLTGSWSGNSYSYTIKDYYDNSSGVTTGYTGTIDASARYTAGETAGKNAVTINKGSWSSGQVQFTKSAGTASTKGVKVGLAGSWSGNSYNYTIYDYYDNSSGVTTGYTGTVDASARYTAGETAGKNAVTINKGTWSGGQISFTKSAGTASTKSVQLTAAAPSWNGNTASVVIWDGTAADAQHGVQTGYTVTVNASARYTAGETAGKNAVTINKGSWSGGQVQFTKSAGTASTKGVKVGLTGSWSGNSYNYTIKDYYDNSSGVTTGYTGTIDASARYTAGFNEGIVAVRQSYNSSNRYVDMVYNGAWTGVTGYYIGDMLDAAAAGVTISSIGTTVGNIDDDTANTYTYTYNATPNPGWYMTLKAKATASNGKYGNANVSFRVQRFANDLYGSGWNAYMNDANWGFIESTGEVYRPTSYGTGGSQTWFNVTDYGYTKGGGGSVSISVNNQQVWGGGTAPWGSAGVTDLNTMSSLVKNYKNQQVYFVFRVAAGSSSKWYRFTSM